MDFSDLAQRVNQTAFSRLGDAAVITLQAGGTLTVRGRLYGQYADYVDDGHGSPLRVPAFLCQAADVAAVQPGDSLTADGTSYVVNDQEPRGLGSVLLLLSLY